MGLPNLTARLVAPVVSANSICLSQTPAAGGEQELIINGSSTSNGIAILTSPTILSISSTANDSARTFTVFGKDGRAVIVSQSFAGPNAGSVSTTLFFDEIPKITVDADTAGAITIGTTNQSVSSWIATDFLSHNTFQVGIHVILSPGANLTYQVEETLDNIHDDKLTVFETLRHAELFNKTVSLSGNYFFQSTGFRLKIEPFTSGSATLKAILNP